MNQENRLYGLDHLRALAITFVFLYHYRIPVFGHPEWLPAAVKFGWTGVDLFFVLSGFLISSHLFTQIKSGNSISIKSFFLKRFFRIIPAFWCMLILYFCFPVFHERESLAPLWKYLTFTQNLGLDLSTSATFSHAWSLCIEEHFYFLLPIVLIVLVYFNFFKRAGWLLLALFLGGFIIRIYVWNRFVSPGGDDSWFTWYKHIYYPTYNRLDGLLAGVSIAGLYCFYPATWGKISKFGNLIFLLGLIVLTGAYYLCLQENSYQATVFGFPAVALGYALLVISAISPTGFLYKWNSKITSFIAMLSYAIYLSHKSVIHLTQLLLGNLGMGLNTNTMLIICSTSCILGALLINTIIEKPFLKLRKQVVKG